MKKIAIYPGTFDPITNGHENIILRSSLLFDQVILGIAHSTRKTPYFSLEDRLQMCRDVFATYDNISAFIMDGLLVDFAKQHQASIILRGLRGAADFDYELQLSGMNHILAPQIETVFLPAVQKNAFISATMVREIISLQGDISSFVPEAVLKYVSNN